MYLRSSGDERERREQRDGRVVLRGREGHATRVSRPSRSVQMKVGSTVSAPRPSSAMPMREMPT